ncbi:MAG: pentapeptide repeat-containing protein [Actinomycetota bacterium]
MSTPGADPIVDLDDRWGTIDGASVRGTIEAEACEQLEIRGSTFHGVTFERGSELSLDVADAVFVDCDLTGLRFTTLTNSAFEGCKLSGVDLTTSVVRDVRFDRCVLRLTMIRMAELQRVRFEDSTLDDVDCYETRLGDVAFPGSSLRAVDLDKATFSRVDLRDAVELDLRSCRRFEGCLITDAQVPALAYLLAQASGISIERPELDEGDE